MWPGGVLPQETKMPKYFSDVRPTTPSANRPVFPMGVPPLLPVQQPEGYPEAPYPAADGAGNGAAKSENHEPKKSGYSNNVPHRDYPSGDGVVSAENNRSGEHVLPTGHGR